MNRIDKLIIELCPDGVEWRELGQCLKRTKGTPITAQQMSKIHKEGAPIKIFAGGKTIAFVDYGDLPEKNILTKESIVVKSRGIIEFEYIDRPFSHKNEFWSYHSDNLDIKIRYVYYYLKSNEKYFQSLGRRMSKMPQLAIPDTDKFSIPIPPLSIQQEIVSILDTFTALDAALQAELEARRKQYEHYRDQLLSFEGKDVNWKTLGEIGNVCMCKRVMKHETKPSGEIPFYKIGTFGKEPDAYICKELYEDYKGRFSFPKEGDILISASGTIGRRVIFDAKPAYFQDSNIVWLSNNEKIILNKFLYYAYEVIEWPVEGGTIKRLYNDNLKKIKIPVPHLAEQHRIVSILDKFDALVNTELPAEIAARRKQYEYYREKLLTFKPLKS